MYNAVCFRKVVQQQNYGAVRRQILVCAWTLIISVHSAERIIKFGQ